MWITYAVILYETFYQERDNNYEFKEEERRNK